MNPSTHAFGLAAIHLAALALSGCSGASRTDSGTLLATEAYVDPNGFFSLTPPNGWGIQDYPDDPRGKVKFARSGTSLSILTNGVDYSDFSSLEIEIKAIDERLGVPSDLKRSEFNGMPAMERDFVIQGSRIWMIDFLIGNVSHNLMYTAPRSRFGTELDRVKASLSTYQPLTREMTEEEVLEHYLAKARRLGRLFIDMGRYEEADFHVGDGLEHHDSDPVLLELRAEIEERRGIARR